MFYYYVNYLGLYIDTQREHRYNFKCHYRSSG